MGDRFYGFSRTQANTLEALSASGDLTGPLATPTVAGVVLQGDAVANVTPAADGTAVGTAFNLLLAALRESGALAT